MANIDTLSQDVAKLRWWNRIQSCLICAGLLVFLLGAQAPINVPNQVKKNMDEIAALKEALTSEANKRSAAIGGIKKELKTGKIVVGEVQADSIKLTRNRAKMVINGESLHLSRGNTAQLDLGLGEVAGQVRNSGFVRLSGDNGYTKLFANRKRLGIRNLEGEEFVYPGP